MGFNKYNTLSSHVARYEQIGYIVQAWIMDDIPHIPKDELERIQKLELFDEYEEWHLFQQHYHILYAKK